MKVFVKSDWNGFFGLFTNNLTNILVLASLLTVVVGFPNDMVYGKILPAVGFSIFISGLYYGWMAVKLAKKENRDTVTALPSGISVPHMFLVVFMIIGPVYWSTKNAYLAWSAGLVWAFLEGLIEFLGSAIGDKVRKYVPRAAMLGSLAGVSITYIALNPAFSIYYIPYIGLVSLAIVLLGFVSKAKMPFNLPVGLVVILFGIIIGWASGLMSFGALRDSFNNLVFGVPIPSISRLIDGFDAVLPFLISAIPFGIYNFLETIDNCESASVAGDNYSTKEAMIVDGTVCMIGSVFGNPFPTATYIGHPGWKEAGARIGYSFSNGLAVFILTILGVVSLLLNIVPVVAILPILLYIGVVITTQAFTSVDGKYAPAVVLSIIPWLADWTRNAVDIVLGQAKTNALEIGYEALNNAGLNYGGMLTLGSGSIIVGMLLGSMAVYIIDYKYKQAAVVCFIGALLSFFGIIHAKSVAINANFQVTLAYIAVMLLFVLYAYFGKKREGIINDEKYSN